MKVGVLALQGDVEAHCSVLRRLGADPVEVRLPEHLPGVDALVMPGGESTTLSLLLGSSGLTSAVSDRIADGMPVLGTCAGMILLAREVLGGRRDQWHAGAIDMTVRRNGWGRQIHSFERDIAVAGVGGGDLTAVFIRAPQVVALGPGVEVLASVPGPDGEPSPVVCRQGAVLVTSFHPEIAGEHRIHELFLSEVGTDHRS